MTDLRHWHIPGEGSERIFFPGLNAVRLLAALAVVVHHLEGFKAFAGLPHLQDIAFIHALGLYGVVCFFVLSGFLITFLLLVESQNTGTVRVGRFYLRRVLRIWPLYFLVVALGTLGASANLGIEALDGCLDEFRWTKLSFYVFFLPNLVSAWMGIVPFLGPLWSIGVEEQFYLTWPWLVKKCRRWLPFWILLAVTLLVTLRWLQPQAYRWLLDTGLSQEAARTLMNFYFNLRLECMAIGGLAAWLLHARKERLLRVLGWPLTQILALGGLLASLALGQQYGFADNLMYGTFYAVLILNIAANRRSLFQLRQRWLDRGGQISYGIYVYHSFLILLLLTALPLQHLPPWLQNLILYPLVFAGTWLASELSFRFFEGKFLALKHRFSVIQSSDQASTTR